MRVTSKLLSPALLPVYFFALTIVIGGLLLHHPASLQTQPISLLDAMFTSVSATCVTGLAVVDTSTQFSRFGHTVLLVLIQIGGLGVMTYASLVFYLWRRRVSLTDRIAVGQSLLGDPAFHLGHFLGRIVVVCAGIELAGAIGLHILSKGRMQGFDAVFHAISAFCNAGFSTCLGNLTDFADDWAVNSIIMLLIILGGLGFYVLLELPALFRIKKTGSAQTHLSWQSAVVLRTSVWLVAIGTVLFFVLEPKLTGNVSGSLLRAAFQSVSARTAGFNTIDLGRMTDTSLFVLVLLMFVGGSPASCAGGIKTTTLRVLLAFGVAQIKGRDQVVVDGHGVDTSTLNKAMSLTIFAGLLVLASVFVLTITEGANVTHEKVDGKFLELFFEATSAFGTVGLSTGLTPNLSVPGKLIIMLLMFVGRLGPIVFVTMAQAWQVREHYRRAEKSMRIG
ncbi:potassium transporter TrkG [Desulfovibrionales bacterium]